MKKLIFLWVVAIALSVAAVSTTGCKTSEIQTTIKTEGILITSVDTAMKIWKDRVVAGKATQSQVDSVKTAYIGYYNAQQLAKGVIERILITGVSTPDELATANLAVTNAQIALLNIINLFLNKPI